MTAIGIDLGTTYSCVAANVNGTVEVIPNDQGNRLTPSVVLFKDNGKVVGEGAIVELDPPNTIYEAKRLIGRSINDAIVQEDMRLWPFRVVSENGADPKVRVRYHGQDMSFSPEQVSANVLEKLKQNAEEYLGHEVKDAVITVPAYFSDAQRRATKLAGELAGLNVLRIINEPTAAGIAYGFIRDFQLERKVLIYDLGGGTFDVSILKVKRDDFEVLAIDGDTHLGGSDFDVLMTNYFIEDFKRKTEVDISNDSRAKARLRRACEQSKRRFAMTPLVSVVVEHLAENHNYRAMMTRSVFENLCGELFERTIDKVKGALQAANLTPADIDEVVLVGGSTRIPKIQSLLSELFPGKELTKAINPDEAVAIGAAHMATQLTRKDDEVNDAIRRLNVQDVTPHSLGVAVEGRYVYVMVPRNSRIPANRSSDAFTNADSGQRNAIIEIYQGEERLAKDNIALGRFMIDITPSAKDQAKIEVAFSYDDNGIIVVKARDLQLDNWREITINYNAGRATERDRARMAVDAQRFRLMDRAEQDRVRALVEFEAQVREIQRTIAGGTFISHARKSSEVVSGHCRELLDWLQGHQEATNEEIAARKAAFDALL